MARPTYIPQANWTDAYGNSAGSQLYNPYTIAQQNSWNDSGLPSYQPIDNAPAPVSPGYGSYLNTQQQDLANSLKKQGVSLSSTGADSNNGDNSFTWRDGLGIGFDAAKVLAGIGSVISQRNMAKKQLDFAKEQFNYNRQANERNWQAQVKAYNTSLYDKYRHRGSYEQGDINAYNSEYERNKMNNQPL